MSEGVWALLNRRFSSLEQLNEFFNVWRQTSTEPEDRFVVEQVRLQAIEKFRERAAAAEAAASQPIPQSTPLPELPSDATDEEKARRLYGEPQERISRQRMPSRSRRQT